MSIKHFSMQVVWVIPLIYLASYAILHGHFESRLPGPFSIEMVRVPYDIEHEISVAEKMGMPGIEAYAS